MKTITLETSKRLEPYLKDIETEYFYKEEYTFNDKSKYIDSDLIILEPKDIGIICTDKYVSFSISSDEYDITSDYKTLTLEEVLEFLPNKHINNPEFRLRIYRDWEGDKWNVSYSTCEPCEDLGIFDGKTLLEAVELMFIYLLDNNLLCTNTKK